MKNYIFFILILFIFSCNTHTERYSYYYLNDNKVVITRIDSERNKLTYLCYGYFKRKKNANSYLFVEDKSMLNGFQALLCYKNNKVVLLQPYEYFKQNKTQNLIQIQRLDEKSFYKIFFDKKNKEYIRIENE